MIIEKLLKKLLKILNLQRNEIIFQYFYNKKLFKV